jgi:poly(A) polymerase
MVRDILIGREPKDVDITTSARPDQLRILFHHVEFVGARFGVTLVRTEDGATVEVATFRTDGSYKDARHPDAVRYTTSAEEDVRRRDFTINALLMDKDGNVIDYVGGRRDQHSRIIRTVGDPDQRFQEDALRMLRAIRFACTLGFTISHSTMRGIQRNASRICNVSAETIARELNRILTSGQAATGINLLSATGLLQFILPEIEILKGCPQIRRWHPEGDVFKHTLQVLRQLKPGCSLTLALGALLHDVGKPATLAFNEKGDPKSHGHHDACVPIAEEVLRRLKFPNTVVEIVTSHVQHHMLFYELGKMRKSRQLQFIGSPWFEELLELHRLDCMGSNSDLSSHLYAESFWVCTPKQEIHPGRLLTGKDLIELGMKPGPLFIDILDRVAVGQLEGTVK